MLPPSRIHTAHQVRDGRSNGRVLVWGATLIELEQFVGSNVQHLGLFSSEDLNGNSSGCAVKQSQTFSNSWTPNAIVQFCYAFTPCILQFIRADLCCVLHDTVWWSYAQRRNWYPLDIQPFNCPAKCPQIRIYPKVSCPLGNAFPVKAFHSQRKAQIE